MTGSEERSLTIGIKHTHNMNKNFRHKFLAGAMLFGFIFAGSSCEDKDVIRVTAETPNADKTLYEVIENDHELTGFVEILDSCGRHCADSLFNQSRVYTVWAPVNSSLDVELASGRTIKDSILSEIAAGNRDVVFHSFVKAHIANYPIAANGTLDEDNIVLLLNNKNAVFTGDYKNGYTFSGIKLDRDNTNIRVKNGILHKIVGPSEYKYSIWEYMKIAKGDNWSIDSVAQYLYHYNVTEFNEGASLPGPPNESGERTFIDSVFTTSNIWLDPWRGVGNINNEDSTYIVYIPSDKLWKNMVEKAEAHFNWDRGFSSDSILTEERDSLQRYYARLHNLKYMTYSVPEQRHVAVDSRDSLMPAYRGGKRRLFAQAELDNPSNIVFEKELSNGTFKVVDAMPYNQIDLWHDTIFIEAENQAWWNWEDDDDIPSGVGTAQAYKNQLNKDYALIGAEVSGSAYFNYLSGGKKATAYFKLPKMLAANYKLAIVFVPKNITNDLIDKATMYPTHITVKIKQEKSVLNGGGNHTMLNIAKKDSIKTNQFKMDTIFLPLEKAPKFSEFYEGDKEDYHIELEIESVKGDDLDEDLRIDKIMLIPVIE